MDVKKTLINQVLLFSFDEIPVYRISHRPTLESVAKEFQFNTAGVLENQSGEPIINFDTGAYRYNDHDYIIKQLSVEQRKIILRLDGSSDIANSFIQELAKVFAELGGSTSDNYMDPILKAEESEVITRLNFPFDKVLAPALVKFINEDVLGTIQSNTPSTSIKPRSLSFSVDYMNDDDELNDYRIGLSRKEFIIAPRKGFPLADQMYYSKAPTDTDTHLGMLQKLENLFS